jgi:hypothetical protein
MYTEYQIKSLQLKMNSAYTKTLISIKIWNPKVEPKQNAQIKALNWNENIWKNLKLKILGPKF